MTDLCSVYFLVPLPKTPFKAGRNPRSGRSVKKGPILQSAGTGHCLSLVHREAAVNLPPKG